MLFSAFLQPAGLGLALSASPTCLPCSLSVPHLPASPQDTALALWIPSVFMSAAEAALSGYCCVAALTLRGVGPYRKEGLQEQVRRTDKKVHSAMTGCVGKVLNWNSEQE